MQNTRALLLRALHSLTTNLSSTLLTLLHHARNPQQRFHLWTNLTALEV